jgi:ABC-type lipoprotein release transport system permease subunit
MILSAVTVLIFLSALAVGVNDAMIRNSVSLHTGHIVGFDLPRSIHKKQLEVKGVAAVLQRYYQYGILLNNNRMTTVTLVGIDPDEEKETTALWKKTIDGVYPSPRTSSLFASSSVAEQLAITPGDTLQFKPEIAAAATTFTVAGIYETGVEQLDQGIAFCPIQALPRQPETFSAAVFLNDGVDPGSVTKHYASMEIPGALFKSWEELMPDLRQLIELNYVSMSIVIFLVFGVVALGISCAFVIFIIINLREYGIMKAMGVTSSETTTLIMAEVALMSLVASCLGIVLGIICVTLVRQTGIDLTAFTSHNRYFAVSGVIHPRLTAFSLWVPPGLALVSGLLAAIWPAAVVIQRKAAEILRGV